MNNPKFHFALCILSLLVFLSACSGFADKPTIHLEPCTVAGTSAQCGSLPVYENRAARTGRIINLNVVVIKSNNPKRVADPVFWLTGGPGYAATQDFGSIAWLLPDRDLVVVDQRGIGGSHEVPPPQPPDWSGLSPADLEKAYADWIKQELPKLDMDPRYYTTSVAMDDLDDVRQALGDEKINLIGDSYGTIAAQYYLRQHEAHVRSVVLISGALTDFPVWERYAPNAQRTLDALFSRCEDDPKCHSAFPSVRSEFTELLERLGNQPVILNDGSFTLSRDLFAAEVEALTRDAVNAAKLPRLIHRAYALDDWVAFGPGADTDAWPLKMMSIVVQCSEKWSAFSPEETARLGQGSYFLGWWLSHAYQYALTCKYPPHGATPEGMSSQPHSDVPVLLFNGEFDPVMPPGSVAGSKEILPNSLALTLPWRGHSLSDGVAQYCVEQITRTFVEDASTRQLSTACLQDLKPIPFDTSQ